MQNFKLDRIMGLGHFPTLLAALPPSKQRSVALQIVKSLAEGDDKIQQAEHVAMLFRFLKPLVLAGSGDVVIVCSPHPSSHAVVAHSS